MERIDHILVVDDDRDIRELIVDYLEKSGYRASGAANGKAMWSVLKNHQIDLVVLDIKNTHDRGLSLFFRIKRDYPRLPVILLSSGPECGVIPYIDEEDLWVKIPKPFEPVFLVKTTSEMLSAALVRAASTG